MEESKADSRVGLTDRSAVIAIAQKTLVLSIIEKNKKTVFGEYTKTMKQLYLVLLPFLCSVGFSQGFGGNLASFLGQQSQGTSTLESVEPIAGKGRLLTIRRSIPDFSLGITYFGKKPTPIPDLKKGEFRIQIEDTDGAATLAFVLFLVRQEA